MNRDEVKLFLKQVIAEETGKTITSLEDEETFHALGLDSISIIVILDALERKYTIELTPLHFWDHPTIGSFTDFVIVMIGQAGQLRK